MMTIDEVIEHAQKLAEWNRMQSNCNMYYNGYNFETDHNLKVVELLKELKELLKYEHRTKDELDELYHIGYEDALDDFKNKLMEEIEHSVIAATLDANCYKDSTINTIIDKVYTELRGVNNDN